MDKVKCEDCGRTLSGPQRACDVCGGKMTYRAAESYYTPEGIIPKKRSSKVSVQTPGKDRRSREDQRKLISAKFDQDKFKDAKGFLKNHPAVKYIVIFGLLLVVTFAIISTDSPDDILTVGIDEFASTDNYSIYLSQAELETYEDEGEKVLNIYFNLEIDDESFSARPLEQLMIITEGEEKYPDQVVVEDEYYAETKKLYEPDYYMYDFEEYGAYNCVATFNNVDEGYDFILAHSLGSQLNHRHKDTDISVSW